VARVDGVRNDLLISLKQHGTIAEIIEERNNGRLDIQTVEPQGKDSGFTLPLCIEVLDFKFLLLGNRVKSRVVVEEISHESQVELWVSCNKRLGCQEFAATKLVSFLKNCLSSVM